MENENPIFQSLEIIENRITEKLTIQSIAADVYISKYYYMRLFRELVGDSVMDYVIRRKLTLAGRALLETQADILEIAMDFGYGSRDGFSRSFKAYMGVTPTQYRKHGLTAISQKKAKERFNMKYSKTTDEIIRELNEWIVKTKDLTDSARKIKNRKYQPFWDNMAEQTDILADRVKTELHRINITNQSLDEITGGLSVIKLLDDILFQMNLLGIQAAMTEAKMATDTNLAHEYRELAYVGHQKVTKASGLFRELSSLIIEDMRKTAKEKLHFVVEKGREVAENVPNNANYIKDEVLRLNEQISSTPVESMSELLLSDCMFKLEIILLTARLNVFPAPDAMIEGMEVFKSALNEAAEFCNSIIEPHKKTDKKHDDEPSPERRIMMTLQDIAFQGNILLFYTRGEFENICAGKERKEVFNKTEAKIDSFIQLALSTEHGTDVSVFKEISDKIYELVNDLNTEAEVLGTDGGALKVLAVEHKNLADRTMRFIKDIETLKTK